MARKIKIGISGLGMVGMPLARYFLKRGFTRNKTLFLFDADQAKDYRDDLGKADVIFICVPTPSKRDGSCDASIVESVIRPWRSSRKIFIIKSTVEPGTAFRLSHKYKVNVFFNPEFLTEANAWGDFLKPDRQIVGHTRNAKIAAQILDLLPKAGFRSPSAGKVLNAAEAEMGKYGSNVFGAFKVAYANVVADFAAALEMDLRKAGIKMPVQYDRIKKVMGADKRIGYAWFDIHHGQYRGFGGYCFPKDIDAFLRFGEKMERQLRGGKKEKELKKLLQHGIRIIRAVRDYNEALLAFQGLTLADVSRHDREVANRLRKRKK